jgi:hypothetical protein
MGPDSTRSRVLKLRLSLLVAAGLVPLACGGAVQGDSGDDPSVGTGGSRGSGKPGTRAGTGNGPVPGVGVGGTTSVGGGGPIIVGGAGPGFPPCTAPKLDSATGLVTCQEGYRHRPTAIACDVAVEPTHGGAGGETAALPRTNGTVNCGTDPSACDAFELGFCHDEWDILGEGGAAAGAQCYSGCQVDQDCGPSSICLCNPGSPTGGICHHTQCVTDRDCDPGYRCATYDVPCGPIGFACQSASDQCSGSNECDYGFCGWGDPNTYRTCENVECGRPFLVGSAARVAPVAETNAWCSRTDWTPAVAHLSDPERQALAEHWTRMGQMEHASIAAFARFALQLLSLGAPPELIEECTSALADETAHAKLCFEIASAYAGRSIGPGPLNVAGSLDVTSLGDIVDLVMVEGCFGETNAALEALEAAGVAGDPVIAAAYARIAADEQRHAELAFRFVRWALERDPLLVRERLRAVLVCPPTNDAHAEDLVVPVLYALLRKNASRELAA